MKLSKTTTAAGFVSSVSFTKFSPFVLLSMKFRLILFIFGDYISGLTPWHVIFYIHGGGWVFGSFHTHEKLVRELAARTDSLVVFPECSRSNFPRLPFHLIPCNSS